MYVLKQFGELIHNRPRSAASNRTASSQRIRHSRLHRTQRDALHWHFTGPALQCVHSYNLIMINQYADQQAAFTSNPQRRGETHTHTTDHSVAAGFFISKMCQNKHWSWKPLGHNHSFPFKYHKKAAFRTSTHSWSVTVDTPPDPGVIFYSQFLKKESSPHKRLFLCC